MVGYESNELFPFGLARVWKLLQDHLDDSLLPRIHPLIKEQRTVSRDGSTVVVDRRIDARGRILRSRWKITSRPPETYRWDVVDGTGPYAIGSWMENSYSSEGPSTRIRSRGDLRIRVLPFFLPQRPVIHRVLDTIDAEDGRYLNG